MLSVPRFSLVEFSTHVALKGKMREGISLQSYVKKITKDLEVSQSQYSTNRYWLTNDALGKT